MKKSFRLVISSILFILVTGCASSKKSGCHCPSWGKEVNAHTSLEKQS